MTMNMLSKSLLNNLLLFISISIAVTQAFYSSTNFQHRNNPHDRSLQYHGSKILSVAVGQLNEEIKEIKSRDTSQQLSFIVDRVTDVSAEPTDLQEISAFAVDVFYGDANNPRLLSVWQFLASPLRRQQMRYLKGYFLDRISMNIQINVNGTYQKSAAKFVAREVVPADNSLLVRAGIVSDLDSRRIINRANHHPRVRWKRGKVVGFVEINKQNFGLPNATDASYRARTAPLISNLCVATSARKSGVGSALLSECEMLVIREKWWKNKNSTMFGPEEIALKVDQDNDLAIQFYQKKGYKSIYMDNEARRITSSGTLLAFEDMPKIGMLKPLSRVYYAKKIGTEVLLFLKEKTSHLSIDIMSFLIDERNDKSC
mmetsp:Transcript_25066/g.28888  ORF Transcript_25066/g.28888 Transcript_25066/m.28888 type:complete len:372 (+) Transcript_25066:58-1173(+)